MKFIIKKIMQNDEILAELHADPSKITVADFIDLFFKEFMSRFQCVIEQTEYTIRNNILASDFTFFYAGRTFNSRSRFDEKLIDCLRIHKMTENNECILHANITVLGKHNYNLTKRIRIEKKPDLNGTQKNIIEGMLSFTFSELENVDSNLALDILDTILAEDISPEKIVQLTRIGWWESIEQTRRIMSHPCPQNRSESYPYFRPPLNPELVVYKDDKGKPAFEQKGLLSLTARNDKTAIPITKQAVVNYIRELLKQQYFTISTTHKLNHAAKKIQTFWYRHKKEEPSHSQRKRKFTDTHHIPLIPSCPSDIDTLPERKRPRGS